MKSNELLRKLKRAGWYEVRISGSHYTMRHKNSTETIVFVYHGSKEMATGTANAILKQAGLK
jgi:predicted RNA binding protein YcfA (HicA-like mRNA interferase family)